MKRSRLPLALKLVVPVVSIALSLLALEGLVRLLKLQAASYNSISGFCRYDPNLGWNLIPDHRTVLRARHFSAVVETSRQGLRDRVYPLEREPGRRRILVIGDSITWCWGVAMDRCFTKLIESRLEDTDVITMGVPGFSTAQELLLYEQEGRRFQADLVLLVFSGNDPVENLDSRKRPRFVLTDGELVRTNYPAPRRKSRFREWLRRNSRLYAQLDFGSHAGQDLLKRLREGGRVDPSAGSAGNRYAMPTRAEASVALEMVLALLERFERTVRDDGSDFAIAATDTASMITEGIASFCSRRGCPYVDTAPAIARAEEAGLRVRLQGDVHFAAAGQEILAGVILESLEGAGWPSADQGVVEIAEACR